MAQGKTEGCVGKLDFLVENPTRILLDPVFFRILHSVLAGLHNGGRFTGSF